MKKNRLEEQKKWSKVIAKAWTDPNFVNYLRANPAKVLKEFDIDTPSGIKWEVVENTSHKRYIVIPERPDENLSIEDLKKVAGGCTCGGNCP